MQRILLLWLLANAGFAEAAPDSDVVVAQLQQQWLPGYSQRTDTAQARVTAATDFFNGESELGAAWPELAGAPLLTPPFIQGQLLQLREREEARSLERLAPPPEGLNQRDAARWSKARDRALEAEDRADQLSRRLFTALSAGLKRAPQLRNQRLDEQVQLWRQDVGALPDPSDPRYPDVARVAAEVGELEAVLARYRNAAVRAMTVPGDLSLVRLVSADLSRQGFVPRSERATQAAADRLRRVQPLLPETLAQEIQATLDTIEMRQLDQRIAALETALKEAVERLVAGVSPEPDVQRDVLVARDQAAQQALEAVQDDTAAILMAEPSEDPLRQRQRRVAQLRLEVAELNASIAAERLRQVPPEVIRSAEEGALKTQAQVDDALRKAEEARRKAEAAGKAEVEALVARLSAISEAVERKENEREERASATIEHLKKRNGERERDVLNAKSALPADREQAFSKAYEAQFRWLAELRRALLASQRDVQELTADNLQTRAKLPEEQQLLNASGADPELVQSVQDTITAIKEALGGRIAQAIREQDEVARMLDQARTDLRSLREGLSSDQRAAVERSAGIDPVLGIAEEVGDLPFLWTEQYRSWRATETWSLSNITRKILAFLLRSFEVVLVFFGWNLLRRQGAHWVEQTLRFVQQIIPERRGGNPRQQLLDQWLSKDLTGLGARLKPAIEPGANVLAAWLVYWFLAEPAPLLGFFALFWMTTASLRLIRPLVDLAVVDSPTARFALIYTSPENHRLLHRTARLMTLWWMATTLASYVSYELLRAELLTDRIEDISRLLLVLIVIRELLRWSAVIRDAVDAHSDDNSWLVQWMSSRSDGQIGAILRAGAGMVYLTTFLLGQLVTLLVEGRAGMGWIGSMIAQHSLKEVNRACPPLNLMERRHIQQDHDTVFLHTSQRDQIRAAYDTWRSEQRRGMVAVIGERGAGKSMLLDRLVDLGGALHPVIRLSPTQRLLQATTLRYWLAAELEITPQAATSTDNMRQALLQLPPRIIVIDDVQRMLLRAVRGFAAIRVLLDLMHATAERHFWISSFHGPAWAFLEGTAVQINLDVFHTRVRLDPLEPARLSGWLSGMTRGTGLDFRFNNLAPNALIHADTTRELARIEAAFWRRLSDISQGNPQVALEYWLDSLRHTLPANSEAVTEDVDPEDVQTSPGVIIEGEVLEISLITPPNINDVEALPDIDLFVLTSIMLHDGLSVPLLARSLNAPPTQARASCRHMEGMGILEQCTDEYRVRVPWRPAVARLLRQKHFLHRQ